MRVPSLETRVVRVISRDGFSRYLTIANTRQWLYLAWTFRNFSQLPETVLSSGQRHLLARMCSNEAGSQRVNWWEVIGTFELPTESCEELFCKVVDRMQTRHAQPDKAADVIAVSQSEHVESESSHRRKPAAAPSHAPRRRSGHRTAAAICVLVLVGAAFAYQRFAETGHVLPAGTMSTFAKLTQITAASAQTTVQTKGPAEAVKAEEPATTQASVGVALTPEVRMHGPEIQTPPAAVQSASAPPAETPAATVSQGPKAAVAAPQVAAEPVKIAEVHTAPVAPRVTAPVKPVEGTPVPVLASESLHQAARPQRLVYPPASNRSGKVLLDLSVNGSGIVENVQVVSGDRALAKAAAETVKTWKYQPTGGEEFKSVVSVTFMGNDAVMVRFPSQEELAGK